jgi:hypothetical protein
MIDVRALSEEKQKELIKDIIKRMCIAYGIDAQKGHQKLLAEYIQAGESTIKSWVFNKRVPYDAMLDCAGKSNTSFDWLLTGIEPAPSFTKETQAKIKDEVTDLVVNAIRFNLLAQEDGPDMFATGVVNVVKEVLY